MAFDPNTRTKTGAHLKVPRAARGNDLASLSEAGTRLVATWETDGSTAGSISAVWDLETGKLLYRTAR